MAEAIEKNPIAPSNSTANELNNEMNSITNDSPSKNKSITTDLINKIGKLNIIFLTIPIVLLIGLAINKPKFLTKEVTDDGDNTKSKLVLNYKKLLLTTLIISLLFPAVYYGYTFYYKKNN